MTALSKLITVAHRSVRAVNVEEDFDARDVLEGYSPGVHVLDALRRIAAGLQSGPRPRAFSITGPYGAGKSSFALLLSALLAADGDPRRELAAALLRKADEQLAETLDRERARLGPMIPALGVATREPAVTALARTIHRGAARRWGRRLPAVLKRIGPETTDPASLMELVEELTREAPLLLVVDELGKTLELAAAEGADVFVLQQVAERLSSSDSVNGMFITLQHLAFEDYLIGVSDTRRREWRKVHGRFDDLPFVGNSAHARRLVADSLIYDRSLDVPELYPLHGLSAEALPSLATQHDRSLVAFLTSDAPHALPAFLRQNEPGALLRPAELYDYFLDDVPPDGALAREIAARVDGCRDGDPIALSVLKTVGVLNLADGLPASRETIVEAVGGNPAAVEVALDGLTERSVLTFRAFAGEYRVWEGSDFDLAGEVAMARERLASHADAAETTIATAAAARPLRPVVAQRHSQRRHVLRYFESRLITPEGIETARTALTGADGLVLWVLAERKPRTKMPAETADGQPLIVLWSSHIGLVRDVALDLRATTEVLQNAPELEHDPVARRELRHRADLLAAALAASIERAFAADDVSCFAAGAKVRRVKLSRLVSDICDARFDRTPVIANEVLNRRELSSQGAKARRMLLEAMFESPAKDGLGIEGYGPERAMYEAVLREPGLHLDGRFQAPRKGSSLSATWKAIISFFDEAASEPRSIADLYEILQAPPLGLKPGPVPVLLAAALQHRSEDVFLYQDGSFEPLVDAALIERLLKTPERFAVKRASMLGVRAEVFEQLRTIVDSAATPTTRNASTLAVVRPLIAFVNELPEYARQTSSASPRAQAVCRALLEAKEPDELLFRDLPEACELQPFAPKARSSEAERKRAVEFVRRLRAALAELGAAFDRLLDDIGELLRHSFGGGVARARLREDLRVRARHLQQHVIDPKLRAFLLTAGDGSLDDADWLQAMAMTLAAKPPSSWSDHDLAAFEALAAERAGWFARLESLYYDQKRTADSGFEARRLTLTAPDGTETHEFIRVDEAARELVSETLETALASLRERLGSEAPKALLGALATEVMVSVQGEQAATSRRKARSA